MQSEPIWNYIYLGTAVRYLQDYKAGWAVVGSQLGAENFQWMLEALETYGLTVSARQANTKLHPLFAEWSAEGAEYRLTAADRERLEHAMESFRDTLEAEAAGRVAYVVTDRRHSASKLLDDVGSLMGSGVFAKLTEIARYDMEQAGKAIAFELPTAAAFHLLRATEQVLRDYYMRWVKRDRVKPLLWGPMVTSLRSRSKAPPDALLNHLDHVRLNFRNPTDHPEKIYDIEEAQDLFSLCCDAIGRMTP